MVVEMVIVEAEEQLLAGSVTVPPGRVMVSGGRITVVGVAEGHVDWLVAEMVIVCVEARQDVDVDEDTGGHVDWPVAGTVIVCVEATQEVGV
jgi:hypothetical protein